MVDRHVLPPQGFLYDSVWYFLNTELVSLHILSRFTFQACHGLLTFSICHASSYFLLIQFWSAKPDVSHTSHGVESNTSRYYITENKCGLLWFLYPCSMNLTWRDMQHLVVRTSQPRHLSALDWRTNGVARRGRSWRFKSSVYPVEFTSGCI